MRRFASAAFAFIAIGFTVFLVGLLLNEDGGEQGSLPPRGSSAEGREDPQAKTATLRGRGVVPSADQPKGTRIAGHVFDEGAGVVASVRLYRKLSPPAWMPPSQWWGWKRTERTLAVRPVDARALAATTSGADGSFALPVPRVGIYEVHAKSKDGRAAYAEVRIEAEGGAQRVDLTLPSGTPSLHGTVRHRDGRPWQGWVVVRMWGRPHRDANHATRLTPTDAEGRYRLHGLSAGDVDLSLIDPGVRVERFPGIEIPRAAPLDIIAGGGAFEVRGRAIHDDTGAPLGGVVVEGRGSYTQASVSVLSAADGSFVLQMPMPKFRVLAHKDGFTSAVFGAVRLPDPLILRLRPASTIRGRVVDIATAQPVPGVPVQAQMGEGVRNALGHVWATSDAEGRFVLEGLHAGDARVIAWGSGWTPANAVPPHTVGMFVTCVPGRVAEVDVPVERAGHVVGRVVDPAGTPIAGAQVKVPMSFLSGSRSTYIPDTVSDAAGAFRIEDVPPCTDFRLLAVAQEHADKEFGPFAIRGGEQTSIKLRLDAARWCDVTVVDTDTGQPIEGASVQARSEANGGGQGVQRTFATDAEGRVRVGPLPPGALGFKAGGPGYLAWTAKKPGTWRVIEGLAAAGTSTQTIRLARGATLTGHVHTPAGAPAGEARISVFAADAPDWKHWRGKGRTDLAGRFALTTPPKGTYLLRVRWRDPEGSPFFANLKTEAGSTEVEVTLRARPQAVSPDDRKGAPLWRIHVLGPDGQPVRAAEGTAFWQYAQGSSSTTLQALGHVFEVQVPRRAGTLHLVVRTARAADGSYLVGGFFGPWPSAGGEATIRLPRGGVIAGQAVDDSGRGVPGVAVTLASIAPNTWPKAAGRVDVASVRTGVEGGFRFEGLAASRYRVSAAPPSGLIDTPSAEVGSGHSDIELRFRTGVDVRVTVLDPHGQPAPGATLDLEPLDPLEGSTTYAQTDPRGVATLRGLDPNGPYRLNVYSEVGERSLFQTIAPWTPADLTVHFNARYDVEGLVRSTQGILLSGVIVTSKSSDGEWEHATTNSAGRFHFYEKPAGDLRLWVDRRPLSPEDVKDRPPTIVRASAKDIALTFEAGWVVELTLEAMPRTSLPRRVRMALSKVGGSGRRIQAHSFVKDGRATLLFIERDKPHRIYVGPTLHGRFAWYEGPMPATGRLTVSLQAGGTISGRVLGFDGKPVASESVVLVGPGVFIPTKTDATGHYTLTGVPPGTWTVRAVALDKRNYVKREAPASAGQTRDFTFSR